MSLVLHLDVIVTLFVYGATISKDRHKTVTKHICIPLYWFKEMSKCYYNVLQACVACVGLTMFAIVHLCIGIYDEPMA